MHLRRLTSTVDRALTWLRRRVLAEWQGPSDLPRALTLEWRLMAARWVGIIFIAPALPFVGLSDRRLMWAWLIVATSIVYNLAVRWYLRRRPTLFASGYTTTLTDTVLCAAMVAVGGGFNSPFAYFLFTIVISIAIRYGYGPSFAAIGLLIGFDGLEKATRGLPLDVAFAFRAAFLVIAGLLACYLRHLTERAESALQDRLVELQRLYADLAVAHQELLSLDEAKTNFLANVSHELRTPLTSIRAFSEMLLSYDDSEDVRREFIAIISTESERLTRLVNDVLDVTKIESGKMDWREEPLDVVALVDQCARTYAPLFEQSRLTFRCMMEAGLPTIRGDRDRLQQVIHNLLSNALKFTVHGSVTLRVSTVGDAVVIALADTGVGIPTDDQARVFDKFQQVGDTLTGKPRGTGLGLTICRDIIEHHGGQLTLESQPGVGSTFSIHLPIDSADRAAA